MDERPSPQVLAAFGLSGQWLKRMSGGQGHAWRAGSVILKPAGQQVEADWVADLLPLVRQVGFRLSLPVRSSTGSATVDGWAAWHRLPGGYDHEIRWPLVLHAGAALFRELAWVAEPAFLAERDDHWSVAERLCWAGALPEHSMLRRPAERLAAWLRPTGRASQLIHGDLTGNVLLAGPVAAPGIIDFTPYWRPASFGLAIVVADAVAWHGAGAALLEDFKQYEPDETRSLVARAALFRLLTADRLAAERLSPTPYRHSHAEAYSRVCTVLDAG